MLLYGSLKVHSLVFKQQWLGKTATLYELEMSCLGDVSLLIQGKRVFSAD